ncbi:MAG: tetratricopeptide repeat protein [Cyanobacteria bacterium J06598_3]
MQANWPTLPATPSLEAQSAIAAYNQGNALAEQGKVDEAIAAYQRAIAINPSNADAHYNLGYWLNTQGDFAAAENAYWQAAKLNPFDAQVYYNLGLTLIAQEKMAAAGVAFERSRLLAHDNSALQTTLSTLLNN